MTNEELEAELRSTMKEAQLARFMVNALIQLLVEHNVLKPSERDALQSADAKAQWVEEYRRAMTEALQKRK